MEFFQTGLFPDMTFSGLDFFRIGLFLQQTFSRSDFSASSCESFFTQTLTHLLGKKHANGVHNHSVSTTASYKFLFQCRNIVF